MHKVSYVLIERFSQDPWKTYFCKQHPPGAWKGNLRLHDFGYANSFQTQKVFKPIVATGNVRDENINFESDKTSSRSKNKNKANLVIFKCFNQPSDT